MLSMFYAQSVNKSAVKARKSRYSGPVQPEDWLLTMSTCIMCRANMHLSCEAESCDCSQVYHLTEELSSLGEQIESLVENGSSEEDYRDDPPEGLASFRNNDTRRNETRTDSGARTRGRESNLKDQQSTGRKRAAELYPLDRERECEWRGRVNCGGGEVPILGCISGTQAARHHGPDKTVSNNNEGNVHRICHYCHNRWHAKNDPLYDWNNPCTTAHAPRKMNEIEQANAVLDEMRYLGTKTLVKVTD